jgi:hypothetical protein
MSREAKVAASCQCKEDLRVPLPRLMRLSLDDPMNLLKCLKSRSVVLNTDSASESYRELLKYRNAILSNCDLIEMW